MDEIEAFRRKGARKGSSGREAEEDKDKSREARGEVPAAQPPSALHHTVHILDGRCQAAREGAR